MNTATQAPTGGLPCVLLHSSMSSKQQWRKLTATLGPSVPTLAVDLHGYGLREMPANGRDFCMADEVALVLAEIDEQLGPDARFKLVGHSYGGAISLRLALAQRPRVAGLALYEPVAFFLLDPHEPARREIDQVVARLDELLGRDDKLAAQTFIDYWNGAGAFAAMPQGVRELFVKQVWKTRLDFQALFNEALGLGDLRALDMPCCLISGLRSPSSTRRIAELLAQTLPALTHHRIDGGHMAPIQHPDRVNPLLLEFLTTVT